MFNIFNILKSKPVSTPITNEEEIDKTYKYWRIRVLYSMYVGYACFYFTRKSFTFAMPELIKTLHFTKAEMGMLGSIFYITYGVSKFISGILADRSNPRYFMAIGLIITGIANIFFGLSSSFILLVVFWLINGFFQGWGWPACARLLTRWYSQRERGMWWGIWNTSHNFGAALIPIIVALCAAWWGWRGAMFVPGVIAILVGFFVINRLSDIPESKGLPPIEVYKNDFPVGDGSFSNEYLSRKEILINLVIKNKYIWLLAISYVLVYVVRTAINDWAALYLTEKGNTLLVANTTVSFFEIGGFFGSLVAGWCSDKIFKGCRGQINTIFSLGIVFAVLAFWLTPNAGYLVNCLCLFALGFLIFGPQMLVGVAAAELSHKYAAATATGFIGLFGYIGAALSGYPIGAITQHWGWTGFFISIAICSVLTVLLLAPLWSVKNAVKS